MSNQKKEFIVRKDGSVMTPEFVVSFPRIFEPGDDGKYGVCMIFDRDVDFSALKRVIEEKYKETWKNKPSGTYLYPILDGNKSDSARPELKDKIYINGKAGQFPPGVVGPDREPIMDKNEIYPGCIARAVVTVYTWIFKGKYGVSVNVRNLQKLRDGEPLITRVRAEDEFSAVEDISAQDF